MPLWIWILIFATLWLVGSGAVHWINKGEAELMSTNWKVLALLGGPLTVGLILFFLLLATLIEVWLRGWRRLSAYMDG